ncbi:MAG: chromosomal replication initiator protein DnaA [Oscillospiraceae bacterium]|nr:chromosomal replication initiator protein DnaA [Oscillospiraceae bacterium]
MNSLQELFLHILQTLQKEEQLIDSSYNIWFKDLVLCRLTESTAYVLVKSDFMLEILTSRYKAMLEKYFKKTIGFPIDVIFLSTENVMGDINDVISNHINNGGIPVGAESSAAFLSRSRKSAAVIPSGAPTGMPAGTLSGIPLAKNEEKPFVPPEIEPENRPEPLSGNLTYNEEYTFENFIVGNTNKYAHAVCLAVANNPAKDYNPLFIYGSSGVGKTHLLFAITNKILKSGKAKNVLYVKGEEFTNQMISSLAQNKPMYYFRDKYRNVDVLLMDDIQFIAGKVAIQEEFFHTFNALHEQGKQIILTSDRPPKDIQTLEERLKTRFEWGLIVDIQPPDLELRIAILKRKSESMGINVPDEVIFYLAEQIKSNIRQLEGAIKKLNAYSLLNDTPIDIKFAKDCIQDIVTGTEPISVTIDKTFSVVSKKYGISVDDIKSKKRTKEISEARHATIYILRTITDLSSNDIGRLFNGQHHTTILAAVEKMNNEISSSPSVEYSISELIRMIKS